ncbi:MAG: HD domain-containing protein [bacterium]|nr:HD domain-containing protein [bacterium]
MSSVELAGVEIVGEYRQVPVSFLRLDKVADFDIYLKPADNRPHILYRQRNLPFTEEARERLASNGIEFVFVPVGQGDAFRRYMERNLGAIIADPGVGPEEKSGILYESLVGLVGEVMDDPRSGEMVPRSQEVVKNTCSFLYGQQGALKHLMKVTSFDYYTYTHSVNVFVFSMALGQRVFDRASISGDYGVGALLHDVGKSMIDPEILNCRGKLTDDQFGVMKKHPGYGCEILLERGGVGQVGMDIVRHHHERPDGSGYPDGLTGDEISKVARVVKISDVFDALTTRRSYKEALSSFPALKLMKDEMAQELDEELFRVFVNMMGNPGA